jgi:type I restriction enzyme S subunit
MSWKKIKLGEILKVRENRFKPNDKAISELKRIDKIDFSGNIFISDKPSNTDMILVKKGDLVISGINVEKGAMAVYTGNEDITATIHYSSYSFNENDIDVEFLKYFLKSIEFKNALKEQVPGGIKTEIKPKHLLPLVVKIPTDINDQREVVKLLNDRNLKVDSISNELTHQLSLVKKLRQSFLQEAVQGKLVAQNPDDEPASELLKKIKAEKEKQIAEKKLKKDKPLPPIQAEEIPFEIPEGWVWCRLGEISEIGTGGTPLTSNSEYYENGNIPWITSSATNNLFVVEPELYITEKALKETNCKVYPTGTLVVAMYGQGKTRGQITELNFPAATNQACATITLFFNDFTLRKYVKLFFQKIYNEIRELAQGGAQPNLNMGKIRDTFIPLPPLSEQTRIVQKLDELMQTCNELEASIKESQTQNEKLLQQVLREALRK